MSYSILVESLKVFSEGEMKAEQLTCNDAYKLCMPPFVFSDAGQGGFRYALMHLVSCRKRDCMALRKDVRECSHKKLRGLFDEGVTLGCSDCHPSLYVSNKVRDLKRNLHFIPLAHHLAHCTHEDCAKLRRSLLLSVRDTVSPSAKSRRLEAAA